jgi:superfamily II DNA or RNA helicase
VLQSIQSLNPDLEADGSLVFDVLPPVLSYLRKKANVKEEPAARDVVVEKTPLSPTASIEFDPRTGVEVKAGYRYGNDPKLIPESELKLTPDGKWARVGNRFVPMPTVLSAAQKTLLQQGGRSVPLPDVPEFFQRDLVLYHTEFNAVLGDLASQVRIVRDPLQPVFHLDQNTPGWLSFHVTYQANGVTVSQDQLNQLGDQPYIRLNPTTWLKADGSIPQEVAEGCEMLGAIPSPGGYRLPAHAFASLEEFMAEVGGRQVVSEAYRRFLDLLVDFRTDDNYRLSEGAEADLQRANIKLRPYQRGGIHWLNWLSQNGLHGILADDMGLGKTLQSIAAMRLAYERTGSQAHSLIVAPKSVLHHWERELHRYYPGMKRYVYHGPGRRRDLLHASHPICFITTYATIKNDIAAFSAIPLFYLILDEATQIKNPTAVRTNAAKSLNAAHRLALSGTPVENRPSELWSLFDFLMRGHLGSQASFQRQFEAPIVDGDHTAAERLGKRIRPFLLRRVKREVAKDLPEKIETEEWCELTQEQRRLYAPLQENAKQIVSLLQAGENVNYATSILPVLTRLLQICDHPAIINQETEPLEGRSEKFDWVVENIAEIVAAQEQVAVFSRFLGMLSLLERAMQIRSIGYMRIDGSTDNRQALIDRFNNRQVPVALLSTLAAGHGINLTAANHVIHADRWWNPAVEDQGTDRVHRIGQTRTVHVHKIIVGGTLEERLDRLLAKKRHMAERIIDAAGGPMGNWTREELIELLKPLH